MAILAIEEKLKESFSRSPYTHFLSLPINDINVRKSVELFHEEVRKVASKLPGFDTSMQVSPDKLHLTIAVMRLSTPESIQNASNLLMELTKTVKLPDPITIRLKGLDIMKGTEKAAHVIYARVEEMTGRTGVLMTLCRSIIEKFHQAGFITDGDSHDPKFHCTLINTKYAERGRSFHTPIDASEIMLRFGGTDFGSLQLDSLHLSIMERPANGGYPYEAKIELY